jgi:hypothetical protein
VTYCIDTSSLIAAWDERYPITHFPKFWQLIEQALRTGNIVTTLAVIDELKHKSDDLRKWLVAIDAGIIPLDEDIQIEAAAILQRHPRLVMEKKQRFAADTFVIATARIKKLTIVTEEKPTGSLARPNIPDVCKDYGVLCISLIQLIRKEGWVLG